MKPAPFKYIAASSLAHALSVKAEYDDEARFLAGGQSLIPAMNFRLARPAVLIDINGLTDLAGIDRTNRAELRLGALTRYRDLERDSDFLKTYSLFADALPHIAHPQIRNRGTIGGNLSHADPASELPAIAVAMEATMRIKSATGERQMAASEFFVGVLSTDLQAHEMLVEIAFPTPKPRTGACFMEVARRRGDFALVGIAVVMTLDDARRCSTVRLALCGVGETAVDVSKVAFPLIGQPCTTEAIETVAAGVRDAITPSGNVHATPDYQRHIAGVLAMRAIGAADQRARHAA